jgi:hypothetical protein
MERRAPYERRRPFSPKNDSKGKSNVNDSSITRLIREAVAGAGAAATIVLGLFFVQAVFGEAADVLVTVGVSVVEVFILLGASAIGAYLIIQDLRCCYRIACLRRERRKHG